MAFVAIPFTAKVEIVAHHATTMLPIVNVCHCSIANPTVPADITALAVAVDGFVHDHPEGWANEWVYDYSRVTSLEAIDSFQATNSTHSGTVGTQGTGLPANSCLLVKLTTDERSRRGRGRFFLSPIAADDVDTNGGVSGALATAIATWFGIFMETFAALSPASALVVASRVTPGSNSVTTATIERIIASQRRRIGR